MSAQDTEKRQRLVANKAKCLACGQVIESKHRHDFVKCRCESIYVDGGLDYIRRGGKLEHIEELSEWEDVDA